MSDQEIVEQFHGILDTLRSVVEASGGLANRVEAVERYNVDTLEALRSIQSSVQALLETYREERAKHLEINKLLADRITALEHRFAAMFGNSLTVM